jgi:hypothetical protein
VRPVVLVGLHVIGAPLSVAVLILVAMRIFAPWPLDGAESKQAAIAVAVTALADLQQEGQTVYLSFDGRDLDEQTLQGIRLVVRGINVRSVSERTHGNDRCSPPEPALGACRSDDFLDVNFLSMPLWHVGLVRSSTAACQSEFTLLKGFLRWHVISHRWLCS